MYTWYAISEIEGHTSRGASTAQRQLATHPNVPRHILRRSYSRIMCSLPAFYWIYIMGQSESVGARGQLIDAGACRLEYGVLIHGVMGRVL